MYSYSNWVSSHKSGYFNNKNYTKPIQKMK